MEVELIDFKIVIKGAIMSDIDLIGVAFISVYTDNYEEAYKFFTEVLGMEKQFDMGNLASYLKYGKDGKEGLYLQGGNDEPEFTESSSRAAFVLSVKSASALYKKLVDHGVKMIQAEPLDMGAGDLWFQCYSPCGHILEFLGGK